MSLNIGHCNKYMSKSLIRLRGTDIRTLLQFAYLGFPWNRQLNVENGENRQLGLVPFHNKRV